MTEWKKGLYEQLEPALLDRLEKVHQELNWILSQTKHSRNRDTITLKKVNEHIKALLELNKIAPV